MEKAPVWAPPFLKEKSCAAWSDGSSLDNSTTAITDPNNSAGWAACILKGGAYKVEIFGPVIRDPISCFYIGADASSNNTAEISALHEALVMMKLLTKDDAPLAICYDSEIAVQSSLGLIHTTANKQLTANTNKLIHAISLTNPIFFLHVKGHSGNYYNEVADFLAKRGALRHISPFSWPLTNPIGNDKNFFMYGVLEGEMMETELARDTEGAPILNAEEENNNSPINDDEIRKRYLKHNIRPPSNDVPINLSMPYKPGTNKRTRFKIPAAAPHAGSSF